MLRQFFISLLIIIWTTAAYPEDPKNAVESIVNSVTKNSEKPLINQGGCCPACPKSSPKKAPDCSDLPSMADLIGKATVIKDGLLILDGKFYLVKMDKKTKEKFIMSKALEIKYFAIVGYGESYKGLVRIKSESNDQRFVREYDKLRSVYSDTGFKELCHYLATNSSEYASAKSRISQKRIM
jgi:hypothetical protein